MYLPVKKYIFSISSRNSNMHHISKIQYIHLLRELYIYIYLHVALNIKNFDPKFTTLPILLPGLFMHLAFWICQITKPNYNVCLGEDTFGIGKPR